MFQHILVAHDLSVEADFALQRAHLLAIQTGAQLSIVHINNGAKPQAVILHTLQEKYQTLIGDLSNIHIINGEIATHINLIAKELPADLLVLGQHHSSSSEHFGGHTLEQLLQSSFIPILLASKHPPQCWSHAIVALDFSAAANHAAQLTGRLLAESGHLKAVHVHEVTPAHTSADLQDEFNFHQSLFEILCADIQKELPNRSIHFEPHWLIGERHYCLQQFIKKHPPTLLALGVHTRNALSTVLIGSIISEWLNYSAFDILLTH